MVIRYSRPQVAAVIAHVATDAPGGQLVGVAAALLDILRGNAVARELAQVGGVELHGAHVVGAIVVAHPLARLATFLAGHGQDDVHRQLVFDRRHDRAGDGFAQGRGRNVSDKWHRGAPQMTLPNLLLIDLVAFGSAFGQLSRKDWRASEVWLSLILPFFFLTMLK
ncbi:hypothetical protein D3C76_1379590 [compost metagenome]